MDKKFWKDVPIIVLNSYSAWIRPGMDVTLKKDLPNLSIFKQENGKEGGHFRKFYIDKSKKEANLSVGRFTEKEIEEIFNKIEKSGFWQMPEYLPSEVEDGGYREIFVNYYWLEGKTKKVIYHVGTPDDEMTVNFMKLFDEIASLANAKPQTDINLRSILLDHKQ